MNMMNPMITCQNYSENFIDNDNNSEQSDVNNFVSVQQDVSDDDELEDLSYSNITSAHVNFETYELLNEYASDAESENSSVCSG